MAVASNPVAGFDTWRVQTLRLTILLNPMPVAADQHWWEGVIGTPAEQVTSQSRQGVRLEQGTFHDNSLILRIQPGKIDWILAAPLQSAEVFENIPTIGAFDAALEIFRPVAHAWLDTCPLFNRLAVGMILLQQTQDRISAYERIQRYLPSIQLDPQSSDFQYQINRPRNSRTGPPNLRINRLMKWHILQWILELQQPTAVVAPPVYERFACSLETDINTAAEYQGDLPRDSYQPIFNELVELSREIARCGDIP